MSSGFSLVFKGWPLGCLDMVCGSDQTVVDMVVVGGGGGVCVQAEGIKC